MSVRNDTESSSTPPCDSVPLACCCLLGCTASVTWLPLGWLVTQGYLLNELARARYTIGLICFLAATIVGLLAQVLTERSALPRPAPSFASPLLCGFGIACFALGSVPTDVSNALVGIGALCFGATWGWSCHFWTYLGEALSTQHFRVACVAALGVNAILYAFLPALGIVLVLVITGVCAIGSGALGIFLLGRFPSRPTAHADVPVLLAQSVRRLRLRLFLACLLLGIAFGSMLLRFVSSPYERVHPWMWGTSIVGVLILLGLIGACRLAYRESDPLLVVRLSMGIVLLSFFPINPGSQLSLVISLFWSSAAAWTLFGALTLAEHEVQLVSRGIARKANGLAPLGAALGASIGCGIGAVLGGANSSAPFATNSLVSISLLGMTAMVISFVATCVLVDRNRLREIRFLKAGKLPLAYAVVEEAQSTPPTNLMARCKQLAMDHDLTPRETEVLTVLACGKSLPQVQEELFISEGTAITHRNHIYRKLGIHSKQELVDLIGPLD